MWSSTMNELAACVGSSSAVVVSDFKKPLSEKTLRKAATIILAIGYADKNAVIAFIKAHVESKVLDHNAKVLLLVENSFSIKRRHEVLETFMSYGFLDISIAFKSANSEIKFEIFQSLAMNLKVLTNPVQADQIFPDKLKNMMGHTYSIIAYNQPPRVIVIKNRILSPLIPFLSAVADHQNASYQIYIIKTVNFLKSLWLNRTMDLSLSYGAYVNADHSKFLNYEEIGYCALVPLPLKSTLFQLIFIKPFDGLTWLFLVLTVACCVAVWWMFRRSGAVDSPWLLAYGIFVMFIGQGVDFSRKNRLVLAIMLQLIIVMIWVLSKAYEGVITSFMIQPIHENKLRTFDDLVASDYKIMTDTYFARSISDSKANKLLSSRLNSSAVRMGGEFSQELARKQFVFILTCDQAENILNKELIKENKSVSEFYYLMPKRFLPHLVQLEASFLNPFLRRFQYFMDLSFQAGLLKIWELYHSMDKPYKTISMLSYDEFEYLKLEDLVQVFAILMIGCMLSSLVILVEILCHDILKKLKFGNLARKLRIRLNQLAYKKRKQPKHPKYQKGALYYIIHRRKKVKRLKARKLKVRRIYVQPRFPMD